MEVYCRGIIGSCINSSNTNMARHKDVEWVLSDLEMGTLESVSVNVAVLMDIRDELKKLNRLVHRPNFIRVPRVLDAIRKSTSKKQKTKK